jgi:hypothetical protein
MTGNEKRQPKWRVSAFFFLAVILFACPVSADDLAKQSQNSGQAVPEPHR